MVRNFPIDVPDGITFNAGAASTAQQIDPKKVYPDVLIYNPGPGVVYGKAGIDLTVTATANSVPIPPGMSQPFYKGLATHLALFSPSGPQACTVICGEGV